MVDFWGRLLLHVVASRQYLDQHSPLNCTGSGGFVDRFVDSICFIWPRGRGTKGLGFEKPFLLRPC